MGGMSLSALLLAAAFVNSDAWNFWLDESLATADREGLKRAVERDVDFYTAGGGVEAVFYNMNFQRTFFPSKAWTPFWKDCAIGADGKLTLRGRPIPEQKGEECPEATYRRMFLTSRNMQEKFPEFMAHRYAYCRAKGVEMWHSMRMDDVHHATVGKEFRPQHGDLWLDHKECVRAWYRHLWRSDWNDNALDYGQKKVYDHHLALVKEYLMDYPSDGLELDWLRSAPVFKPGFDEPNAPLLTEFVREVKRTAVAAERKWGRRMRIAMRVPARVRDAYGLGMDIGTWAKEGLVDVLIPGGVPGVCTEADIDIAIYRALAPKPVVIAPELNCRVAGRPGRSVAFDRALDAGFASAFYQAGADAVYFYNHFPYHNAKFPWVKGFFAQASDRAAVAALGRRHVLTWHQPTGEGRFAEENFPAAIWPKCCNGGVKVNCGERTAGRKARVVFGATVPLEVDVLVNTVRCAEPVAAEPANVPRPKDARYYSAEIPVGALHDGVNAIELFNRGKETILPEQMTWLEVAIDGE